jgi:hypothetical protein
MTFAETMRAIEQDEFAAEMNLAAGTKAFRRRLREHNLFRRLTELAKENPAEVAGRIEGISHLEIDQGYENPFDTALSAYLMALSDVAEPERISKAAAAVLRTPKCWWASGLARELLLQTVAVGAIGAGVDWREAVYARVNNWLTAVHASGTETTIRELLRAVSAGQPAGQGNNVIEFPSPAKRAVSHQHIVPKELIRRRRNSSRPHNIAKARRQA